MLESELQDALVLRAPYDLPDLRLFRRNVGTVKVGKRIIRFGQKGQCDLYALGRGGLHVELELKTATGTRSPDQTRWAEFCEEFDIPYACLKARSSETIDQTVTRWIEEIASLCRIRGIWPIRSPEATPTGRPHPR